MTPWHRVMRQAVRQTGIVRSSLYPKISRATVRRICLKIAVAVFYLQRQATPRKYQVPGGINTVMFPTIFKQHRQQLVMQRR